MSHHRPWSVFFAVASAVIVVFIMLPGLFGMYSFTQWGGMYVNAWCTVDVYSGRPDAAGVLHEALIAGTTATSVVWYGPQYSLEVCVEWARSRCGRTSTDGWVIGWARPFFRGKHFLDPANACDLPERVPSWFPNA